MTIIPFTAAAVNTASYLLRRFKCRGLRTNHARALTIFKRALRKELGWREVA